MTKNLVVNEKYSRYWPAVTLVSAILAVLFFIGFLVVSNVLYEGYLRLFSFSFFALSVLSFYKVRDGRIQIKLETIDKKELRITYSTADNRLLYQEVMDRKDLSEVVIDEIPNRSLYNDLVKSDRCIKVRKKGAKHWIYLNSVNGRVLPLSFENAAAIEKFITNG